MKNRTDPEDVCTAAEGETLDVAEPVTTEVSVTVLVGPMEEVDEGSDEVEVVVGILEVLEVEGGRLVVVEG